ncbi:MAG TPA: hemolysin III family protein [Rectinemataceae bacterium]|nr:hemolysin III family protein [Rectinemataceae bacterium]
MDARRFETHNERRYSTGEEIANAVTHGTGALLSVAALVLLVLSAALRGDALTVAAYAVFGSSLVLLFTMSTIYHALRAPRAKRVFEVLDHSSIYVLIAGTYSAFCATALRGRAGLLLIILCWTFAAAGITFKAFFIDRYRLLATLGYVVMGWLIAPFLGQVRSSVPAGAFALLAAGGAAYTLGAALYSLKRVPWFHAVWHLFVLAGAACHVASALIIVGA